MKEILSYWDISLGLIVIGWESLNGINMKSIEKSVMIGCLEKVNGCFQRTIALSILCVCF